jgi:hypothetical protein
MVLADIRILNGPAPAGFHEIFGPSGNPIEAELGANEHSGVSMSFLGEIRPGIVKITN